MTNWISCHGHSTFSLLDGISKPQEIANKCKENGMPACAITDHGTLSGTLKFVKACKDAKIKPILGNEMYICGEPADVKTQANRQLSHLVVLSKSLQGWRNLIKASSASHASAHFYYKPRLDIKTLGKYANGEFIVISGHLGSTLANSLLTDLRAPYKAQTYEEARKFIRADWKTVVEDYVALYSQLFGKENVKFEIQLIDADRLPIARVIANILRHMGPKLGIDCVATADSHYINQEDAALQRIVLCTRFQTTLRQVQNRIDNEEDTELGGFFQSNNYHLPTPEEMTRIHTGFEGELENSLKIADSCADYNILKPPSAPKFGPDDDTLLKTMCHNGWNSKVLGKIPEDKLGEYTERLERELSVLQGAGLSSYFCIVQDFLQKANDRGELTVVRGCLTSDAIVYVNGTESKKIDDVIAGDFVITQDGSHQKVTNTFEYSIEEELVTLKIWHSRPLTLTLDHKILVERVIRPPNYHKWKPSTRKVNGVPPKPRGQLEWIEAKDVSVGDWVYTPIPQRIVLDELPLVDLSIYCDEEKYRFDDEFVYHDVLNVLCNTTQKRYNKKIPRYIQIDDDWLVVLGYFMGDGWLVKKKLQLGFVFHKDDAEMIAFIKSHFENIGCKVITRAYKNIIQLMINSGNLYRWFQDLFDGYHYKANTKHVPKFIFRCTNKQIETFLDGYRKADGHIKKRRIFYTTVSKRLAYQIKLLYLYLGKTCNINIYKRNDKRPEFKNSQLQYTMYVSVEQSDFCCHIDKKGIYTQVRSINRKITKTKVYDIAVENNHNYTTTSCLVHNSATGCLVSYLIGISDVDPIKYGLLFERFYNAGRNTPGHISFPDIDCDLETANRHKTIEYIKEKYGKEHVGQICTFGRLMGRAALKDVLRVNEACSYDEMNEITKFIPDESKISDDLQEMREEGQEASIILWALQNNAKDLKQWCEIREDGTFEGRFARYFKQAMRLEGVKRSQGKHAAGLVITTEPISDVVPMIYDKSNPDDPICGYEFTDVEAVGGLKIDLLGTTVLDKLSGVQRFLATGEVE